MRISYRQLFYFMICAVLMFLPRRWFIFGVQSYRLVILILLFISCKRLRFSKNFFNVVTIVYIGYVAGYYLLDSGIMSFLGFAIDTIGLFVLMDSNIRSESDLQCFFDVFVKCVVVYSICCIVQTLTEFNIFDVIAGVKSGVASTAVYYRFGMVRSYGSFTTSINNALFLDMAVCIILYKFENAVGRAKKRNMGLAIVVTIAGVISTLSRFPLLMLAFILVCWSIKKGLLNLLYRNALKVCASLVIIVLVFIGSESVRSYSSNFVNMFLAVFNDSAQTAISDSFGVNAGGVGERLLLYVWVQDEIEGKELFGVGPAADIVFRYTDEWNKVREKTSIENQYLKMLSYFGYVGLTLYILFIASMLIYNAKKLKYGDKGVFDFWYMSFVAQLTYVICTFTVASVDDMRTYFLIIAGVFIMARNQNSRNFTLEENKTI